MGEQINSLMMRFCFVGTADMSEDVVDGMLFCRAVVKPYTFVYHCNCTIFVVDTFAPVFREQRHCSRLAENGGLNSTLVNLQCAAIDKTSQVN